MLGPLEDVSVAEAGATTEGSPDIEGAASVPPIGSRSVAVCVLKGRRSSGELSRVGGRQYYYIPGQVETDNTSEVDIKVDTTRK